MANLLGSPEELIRAQAQVASPDVVFGMLKKYRAHIIEESSGRFMNAGGDKEFEEIILKRNDLGLNLELAYSAMDDDVIRALWRQSEDVTLDAIYRRGIKVAVLTGLRPSSIFKVEGSFDRERGSIDPIEFFQDDSAESNFVYLFLTNPFAIGYVGSFMKDEEFLGKFPEDLRPVLFRYMVQNPLINRDLSNIDGPDFTHWNIQKGIERFFVSAPVNKLSFWAFDDAISNINSSSLYLKPDLFKTIVDRWSRVDMGESQIDGFYTNLDLVQENICRFSAMFSHVDKSQKMGAEAISKIPNLVERYAYYGKRRFNSDEVGTLMELDCQNFRFGVMFNESTLRDLKARQVIEEWVGDEGSIYYLFQRACKRIKEKYPSYQLPEGVKSESTDSRVTTEQIESQIASLKQLVVDLSNSNQKAESLIKYILGIVVVILFSLFSKFY
jgi:hypothetical protein